MITVLGHIHTGTTCLAQCLVNAGVDFGNHLNDKLEDMRLIQAYIDAIKLTAIGADVRENYRSDLMFRTIISEDISFKHPLTGVLLDKRLMLKPDLQFICVLRSPQNWAATMDGHQVAFGYSPVGDQSNKLWPIPRKVGPKECTGVYKYSCQQWGSTYGRILELRQERAFPIVLYGADDFEEQLKDAFDDLGLRYNGGYDPSKVHEKDPETWIHESVADIYYGLKSYVGRRSRTAH